MPEIPIEAVPWFMVVIIIPSLYYMFNMIRNQGKDIYKRINEADKEIDSFKLYVAENYASNKKLEETEKRIIAAITELKQDWKVSK